MREYAPTLHCKNSQTRRQNTCIYTWRIASCMRESQLPILNRRKLHLLLHCVRASVTRTGRALPYNSSLWLLVSSTWNDQLPTVGVLRKLHRQVVHIRMHYNVHLVCMVMAGSLECHHNDVHAQSTVTRKLVWCML